MRKTILIVDDSNVGRMLLAGLLKERYDVLNAGSGEEALEIIERGGSKISAVVLDLIMPGMDGFAVLEKLRSQKSTCLLPVIVTTGLEDEQTREKAMLYGADGYVTKPFSRTLLLHSIENAVNLYETQARANELWQDKLTGLLNRETFFHEAHALIQSHEPGYYVLSCFNIENFKVINNQYGTEKGDEVLKHVARSVSSFVSGIGGLSCRFSADKFAILYPADMKDSAEVARKHMESMSPACINRKLRVRVGRYFVTDASVSVSSMFDRAAMAEASIKGRYGSYIADYDNSMMEKLLHEQRIINAMADALNNGEFEPWLQPQYDHSSGAMIGAEALVRWRRDGRMVPPGDFIPIFERNGFVYELDQCVWRQVCALLRKWLDAGYEPLPVSVNVSRYDMFQPDFLATICSLVEEFSLPTELLRLEITESALVESSDGIIDMVKKLVDFGFMVEIDDFGSGYSSLNTLKDVPAGIVKLDMKFLEGGESKRGGSIIESVVRMVKWLGMSVIAEGVEFREQAEYLKSIGCCYVQGYLYAKPMQASEYEKLLLSADKQPKLNILSTLDTLDSNEFWNPKSMETLIFNSYVGGASIIEYHGGTTELIRANERFKQEFAGAFIGGVPLASISPDSCLDGENLRIMYDNIERAIASKKESTCEVRITGLDGGTPLFLRCTLRAIAWTNDRYLLYCVINNVTAQRLAERLERDRNAELLDNLPCGAGLYEFDGKNLTALHLNREYWAMVGRPENLGEGIDAFSAVHPDDRALILPEISDAILQKRDAVCDLRIHCTRGDYKKLHLIVRILRRDDSKYSLYAFFIPATEDALLLAEQSKSRRERDRLDFVFKNAAISVWSYNVRTGQIIQNERSRQLHGFGPVIPNVPESIIGSDYVHPDYVDAYRALYRKLSEGVSEAEGVFRVRKLDRSGYWFEHIRYAAIFGDGAQPQLYFGISSDVTAEYEQDNAIRQWMSLVSDMQVEKNAICEFNLTKNVFVRRQGNLFPPPEHSHGEAFEAYILSWVQRNVKADDAEMVIDFLNREKLLEMHARGVMDGGIDYRALIDGKTRWCSLSIRFIEYPADEDVRLIMVHTDINSRKEDELRLIEENRHDALTGVLNRRAFEHQVNDILAEKSAGTHALLMIDLDSFKLINDNFGHITGDNVLIKTAQGLKSLLRSGDLVGRIGGDEFMVFMRGIPSRELVKVRAQMILEMMHTVIDEKIQVSGSIGTAMAPNDGVSFEQLYRCADKAAYYSKQHGKNCCTFYEATPEMDASYKEATSSIDFESETAMKAWDERTKLVMEENQRLIERQEEDERYRRVIESTHIVTFEWNAVTEKFAASPEFFEYVLSQQEGGQFFSENVDVSGIHPDDRALFYGKFLEKVLSGESAQETALRLELKKGGYRWCRLGALVSFDRAERLQKAIGIISQENVQKKQSDIQLDAIFKFMSAGVMLLEVKNPEISALYISESYFRLENTDDVTVSDEDALRYVHQDDYQRLKNKLIICSVSGAVMEETFRVVRNGKTFWRHMHAVRIPYPEVEFPVMIAVETDITDIKRREERLEKRQRAIGSVLEELNVMSWYYYPKEHKTVLNTLSLDEDALPHEVINAPRCFVENGMIHADDTQKFLHLHEMIDAGEESAAETVRVKGPDGGYTARRIVYISIPDSGGQAGCVIGISELADNNKA